MDKCSSDAEFDSYWEFEAKNKNRNRIRVGRQYQASIPPLLKPGEKDARKCEDLETLKWKPEQISEQDVDSYLSMAKAVSSFARTIENYRGPEKPPENSLQTAIKGLTEFVTSHHPCHRDAGCKVPVSASSSSSSASLPSSSTDVSSSKPNAPSDWTPPEARLFAQALETCGKNFCAIKKEFLPWKPVRSLIEYYYYFNCKGEKAESPKSPGESLPESSIKVEKAELVESLKQDTVVESSDKIESPDTKDEKPPQEILKPEPELQATPVKQEEEQKTSECEELPLPQSENQSSVDQESSAAQATVGCLKFFLGGRLVLKLNAQQEGNTGMKCHWVQSHDTPKYGHQSKKMRHRKKSIQDALPQVSSPSPKSKKKCDEESSNNQDYLSVKKLKLKPDTFPLLCSSSWTPPVADGRDAVELDDASSKTSEGHDSPVVIANRGIKVEDAKRELATDFHELKYDKKTWPVTEFIPGMPVDRREEYSSNMTAEKVSPDVSYSHDVINHKSALTPTKFQVKGLSTQTHLAHSSSPNSKPFNKWSDSTLDLSSSERPKCLPCFHSPSSRSCHASPENSSREYVCNKEDCSGSSSPNSVMSSSAADGFPKNQQMWFGPPMPPLLQIYPQCYPYYVAYDMSQSVSSNPSPSEAPLDLSSSDTGKENPTVNNISELGIDIPKNATETMDRGMLYQLLKNKVSK